MATEAPSNQGWLNSGREIAKFMAMDYNTPRMEVIDAVITSSALNNMLMPTDFEWDAGMLRRVKVSYYPQECDTVADDCSNTICDTGDVASPIQQWYTLDKCIQTKTKRLLPNDVRYVDGGWSFTRHALEQMRASIGALIKQWATDITTDILANKGLHIDGSEFGVRVNLVQTTDGLITPIGITAISEEFARGAYVDPFIIGSSQVFQFRKFFGMAAVNTTLGQDFTKAGIPNLYFDVNLDTIKGKQPGDPETIIAYDPRALKLITFAENAGRWATDLQSLNGDALDRMFKNGNESVLLGSFVIPGYPVIFDLDVHHKICVDNSKTGAFDWKLRLLYDIFYTPVQTCNAQGVTGIFEYETCPAVIAACPSGDDPAPSPAPVSSVRSWTPGDILPLLVSNITLTNASGASFNDEPNTSVASLAELATLMGAVYNGQYIFSVDGSDIKYTGYSAISGTINVGGDEITITFA